MFPAYHYPMFPFIYYLNIQYNLNGYIFSFGLSILHCSLTVLYYIYVARNVLQRLKMLTV